MIWTLTFQPATGGWPVTLSWNPMTLPPGQFRLQDSGGTLIDVNMKTQHQLPLDSSQPTTLLIRYTAPLAADQTSRSVALETGWNLIGLPVDVADGTLTALFPSAEVGSLFQYEGTYQPTSYLVPGLGYWMRSTQTLTQTVTGYPVNGLTFWLAPGWNLIAFPSCTINLPLDATEDPGGLVTTVYEYGGTAIGYQAATTLQPGRGYWVQATAAGMIQPTCDATPPPQAATTATASATAIPPNAVVLLFQNDLGAHRRLYLATDPIDPEAYLHYSLPPRPPEPSLDIRFENNTRLTGNGEAIVQLQGIHPLYPVQLSLEQTPGEGTLTVQVLRERTGGEVYTLTADAHLLLSDSTITALQIRWEPALIEIPNTFRIDPNYPNPFTEETYLTMDLPEAGKVQVEVFDLLGRRVYRWEQQVSAGYQKRIRIRLAQQPAGTYVYRVIVRTVSQTYTHTGRMVRLH